MERFRDYLRSSLWFLPGLALLSAVGLSFSTITIDRHFGYAVTLPFELASDAESAQGLLSLISSWMLTFVGLAFTMTMIVLQLASAQFSPRVMGTLLRDRFSQLSLGIFIGTFAYAFVLSRQIGTGSNEELVPAISVSVAFTLVLVSLGVFVRFVNHVAQSIRATSMIRTVVEATKKEYEEQWPRRMSTRGGEEWRPYRTIPAPTAGILRSFDAKGLVAIAREWNIVLEIVPRVGGFIPAAAPLVRVLGDSVIVDEGSVLSQIHVGRERTMTQDPLFGFRQLVDIAERALSPGVNDPTTAVQVIDQIHDLLRDLLFRDIPNGTHRDADGTVRLVVPTPAWSDFLKLGIEEIRHYGADSIQVSRRLHSMLTDLQSVAPREYRKTIDEELAYLEESAHRHLSELEDSREP